MTDTDNAETNSAETNSAETNSAETNSAETNNLSCGDGQMEPMAGDGDCEEGHIWATVIGAGITGLSVAHELVERGFRVQVIEKANGSPMDIRRSIFGASLCSTQLREEAETIATDFSVGCALVDVGGVARTQWAVIPDDACLSTGHDMSSSDPTMRSLVRYAKSSNANINKLFAHLHATDDNTQHALFDVVTSALECEVLAGLPELSKRRFEERIGLVGQGKLSVRLGFSFMMQWLTGVLTKLSSSQRAALVSQLLAQLADGGQLHQQTTQLLDTPAMTSFQQWLASWLPATTSAAVSPVAASPVAPAPAGPSVGGGLPAAISLQRPLPPPIIAPPQSEVSEGALLLSFHTGSKASNTPADDWDDRIAAWAAATTGEGLTLQLVKVRYKLNGDYPKSLPADAVSPQWFESEKYSGAETRVNVFANVLAENSSAAADILRESYKLACTTVVIEVDAADIEQIVAAGGVAVGLFIQVFDNVRLVPGEHGYRFFAGFYRHLRHTMKRTPLYDPVLCRFTERTAHDNLVEVKWQAVADPERAAPTAFPRVPVRSLTAARDMYRRIRRDLGYRPADMLRFMLRMARFMTSCSKRRERCYEDLSWWDFLSLRRLRNCPSSSYPPTETAERLPYGRRFAVALQHSPEALVAMNGATADARTQGNISVQLFMDNLGLHEQSDSTLVGPTSEAWFQHWKMYLQRQGVTFVVAEVTDIVQPLGLGNPKILEIVAGLEGGGALDTHPSFRQPSIDHDADKPHYIICATDTQAAADVTKLLAPQGGTLATLQGFAYPPFFGVPSDPRLTTLQDADPKERYQTLTGIQLFYNCRVSFADAHIYFAQSPWGLSAVSQFQYWQPYLYEPAQQPSFLGNFSLDIGSWRGRLAAGDTITSTPGGKPWTLLSSSNVEVDIAGWMPSERNQPAPFFNPSSYHHTDIAERVQAQVEECLGSNAGLTTPRAKFFHLDAMLALDSAGYVVRNDYPFLTNVFGDWQNRPQGGLWSPLDGNQRGRCAGDGQYYDDSGQEVDSDDASALFWHQGGYPVHFDSLVFAGTFMPSYTRLGTMESANESARHAVNAILDHLCRDHIQCDPLADVPTPPFDVPSPIEPQYLWTAFGDYCSIWDPEQHEVDDLKFLKLVDHYLLRADTPAAISPTYQDDRPRGDDSVQTATDLPHLFDLLELDSLPDMIDDDADAWRVFDVLDAGLRALREADALDDTELARAVERVRVRVQGLFRT